MPVPTKQEGSPRLGVDVCHAPSTKTFSYLCQGVLAHGGVWQGRLARAKGSPPAPWKGIIGRNFKNNEIYDFLFYRYGRWEGLERRKWVVIDVGVFLDTPASHSDNFFFGIFGAPPPLSATVPPGTPGRVRSSV